MVVAVGMAGTVEGMVVPRVREVGSHEMVSRVWFGDGVLLLHFLPFHGYWKGGLFYTTPLHLLSFKRSGLFLFFRGVISSSVFSSYYFSLSTCSSS